MIKYSIIIPTLNGFDTLRKTIKPILSINRNDFEIILSVNNSDDDTFNYFYKISDKRLVVIQPSVRLPHSAHLNFAYKHSIGQYIGHLGDDDLFPLNRFDVLDQIVDDFDLLVGSSIRYIWPNNNSEQPNSICALRNAFPEFSAEENVVSGKNFFSTLLNQKQINGGGEWLVSRRVYDRVVKEFGFFSPDSAAVEFFSLRASAFFSKEVLLVDYPLFINGRAGKSMGRYMTRNKNKNNLIDWNFENPGGWKFAPLSVNSYLAISMDAAMHIERELSMGSLNKSYWAQEFIKSLVFDFPVYHSGKKLNDAIWLVLFDLIRFGIRYPLATSGALFKVLFEFFRKKASKIGKPRQKIYYDAKDFDINSIEDLAEAAPKLWPYPLDSSKNRNMF